MEGKYPPQHNFRFRRGAELGIVLIFWRVVAVWFVAQLRSGAGLVRVFEAGVRGRGRPRVRGSARLRLDSGLLPPARLAAMPLHKFPVVLWKRLRLREGIYSRLPQHYLRSLEEARTPTPVHYRPHGAKFKVNPQNGQRERVEDVPIPIHYPRESQLGLWGGEGWILGHRYVNNDKVGEQGRLQGDFTGVLLLWTPCWAPEGPGEQKGDRPVPRRVTVWWRQVPQRAC